MQYLAQLMPQPALGAKPIATPPTVAIGPNQQIDLAMRQYGYDMGYITLVYKKTYPD